jgi:adenylate cyclase class IV
LVGRTRIHLDEVERLGTFIELEVVLRDDEPVHVGEREAHELMEALGISAAALVPDAYIDLLERAAV